MTLEVARRPVSDILRLAADVDLVHVCYYLLVHPVAVAMGTVEAVRVVSAVAMAVTAGLVLLIGRRLAGTSTGVTASLLLTVSPMASRFAQEARPAAVVTLVVTAGTVTLLTALQCGGRRRWGGYLVLVVLAALFNVLSLLVLAAHGTFVLVHHRDRMRSWLPAAAAAVVGSAPFVAATFRQRDQIAWLSKPAAGDLLGLLDYLWPRFSWLLVGLAVGLSVVGPLLVLVMHRRVPTARLRRAVARRSALTLGAVWLLLPAGLLFGLSQVQAVFDVRYLTFCVPGAALLCGGLLVSVVDLGRRFGGFGVSVVTAGLIAAVLTIGSIGPDLMLRTETGHREDSRAVARYLAAHAGPSDGLLFAPHHLRVLLVEDPPDRLDARDLSLEQDPVGSHTIAGIEAVGPASVRHRIQSVARVWLVAPQVTPERTDVDKAKVRALTDCFTAGGEVDISGFRVVEYSRRADCPR